MTLCYALPFKLQENDVSKCNQKMCIHEVCEKATHFVCMTLRSGSGSGSMSTAGAHGRFDYSQREQWECERCNKGYVGTRAQVLYSNRSLAMSSLSPVRSHTLSMTMILQQRKIHPNNGEGSLSLLYLMFTLFTFQTESLKCFLSQRYPTSVRLLFFDLIRTFHYYIASALSILSPSACGSRSFSLSSKQCKGGHN